jgi:uncharacterized protein (TIGR02594 family)
MTIKKLVIAIAMTLVLTAASNARQINCDDRGCREEISYNYKVNKKQKQDISYQSSGNLLAKAESHLGTNPTGWARLWCARFIAVIAPDLANRLQAMGGNPNWARDYARLPGAKRSGQVGDLVVLKRGKGGHIGIVKGFNANGDPIVISGNHGKKVGEGIYSKTRVLAYVSE